MHKAHCIEQLRDYLGRHGLPRQRMERIVREVAEHWQDAHSAALDAGLEPEGARLHAEEAVGDPVVLANSFIAQFRRSTWLGRHRWFALACLPTLLSIAVFAFMALPLWGIEELTNLSEMDFWKRAPYVQAGVVIAWTLYCLGTAFVPLLLSWWGWRTGLGRRFIGFIWASCAFAALFRFFEASALKRHIVLGFHFPLRLDTHSIVVLLLHLGIGAALLSYIRIGNQNRIGSAEKI
jgi:hypothetical protein